MLAYALGELDKSEARQVEAFLQANEEAARFVREEFDKGELQRPRRRRALGAEPTAPALGKKAQAVQDAASAHEGTQWAKRLQ